MVFMQAGNRHNPFGKPLLLFAELGYTMLMRAGLVLFTLHFCLLTATASDWPSWRGPHGNGTAEGDGYAISWSDSTNIAWKIDLPGKAGSTPIVAHDRLILTCGIDGKNGVVCYDLQGKELWRATFGEERAGKHRKGSGCNPSPVTDGKSIFVYYKNGDFAAVDFDGKVLWQRNLQKDYGEDTLWWDLGTSPVLTSQHVVVACVQTGPSYLAAFNKQTGETVWKVDRNTGAPEEAAQTYATPVVTTHNGQEQIIVLGADQVTCHSAADGKELWFLAGMNPDQDKYFRSISSPVVSGDIVIAPYSRGKTITAIRMGGSGDISKTHVLWRKDGPSADVPTPVAVDGLVYVCTDKGTVACLKAESGEEVWSVELEKNRNAYSASPVLVDGHVYVVQEDGKAFVLNAGPGDRIAAENSLDDEFVVATPVFVGGNIYLRTFDRLYCIQSSSRAAAQ